MTNAATLREFSQSQFLDPEATTQEPSGKDAQTAKCTRGSGSEKTKKHHHSETRKSSSEAYFYSAAVTIAIVSVLSLFVAGKQEFPIEGSLRSLKQPSAFGSFSMGSVMGGTGATASSTLSKTQRPLFLESSVSSLANGKLEGKINEEHSSAFPLAVVAPSSLIRIDPSSNFSTPRVQQIVVKNGETLATVWSKYGAHPSGGDRAGKAIGELFRASSLKNRTAPFSRGSVLKAGDKIQLTVVGSDIISYRQTYADGYTVALKGGSLQGYEGALTAPVITEETRVVSGAIESTLSEAARAADLPSGIVDQLVDLFGNRVDFRKDLHKGDTFAVKYMSRQSDSLGEIEPGPALAISLRVDGELLAAIRHVDSGVYLDENGQPLGDFFLKYPLSFSRISSVYSDSRMHPVLHSKRPHYGVDFAAPIGTPVRTIGNGVVESAGYAGAAGKMVKIRHNETYSTAYLHLNSINPQIKIGSKVERGQVIGQVGKTGLASGPHLHYSLYKNGKYTDPMKESLAGISSGLKMIDSRALNVVLKELGSYHNEYLRRISSTKNSAQKNGKRSFKRESLDTIANDPRLRI
jgi:murein DD-endopeptidase MepM/ murein hydrolase activator NlpD